MDNGASSYRRYLDGDESALDEIIDELFFGLVFFVNRYVHNIHDAEDIAMDAISDLFVNKKRFNFKVSLKTYLYMMGKSRALNHLKRHPTVALDEISELADENDLEQTVLRDERSRIVNAALEKLPDDMRIAIHLTFFENMSCDEAAKVMGKNRKQVYNLIYRAKEELRELIGEKGRDLI